MNPSTALSLLTEILRRERARRDRELRVLASRLANVESALDPK